MGTAVAVPLYEASVPVCLRYLERLRAWLLLAEAAGLPLEARLAPDMLDLQSQAAVACNFALRLCFPLAGEAVPVYGEYASGYAGLFERIERTRARLHALEPRQFEGGGEKDAPLWIAEQAGEARVHLPVAEFLQLYALPNFFFHLGMAYAILRQQGLALGKAEFDGFHVYGSARP